LLVENAVKHNVASQQKPLLIKIISDRRDIIVFNNFQPKTDQKGSGMGLKNISSRYAYLTNKKVEIMNDKSIFEVKIPLI